MAKNKNLNWVLIGSIAFLIFIGPKFGIFSITGNEQMTRTVSSTTVNPGQTFTVTYTVSQATPPWGVSIVDGVSGGCQFPAGNSYRSVMLSDEGNTKTVQVTAPQSGSCTFTGDYKFGSLSQISLQSLTVNVCSASCSRPSNLCIDANTISNGCGGFCTGSWNVLRNTNADLNCDNKVDRTELTSYITKWVSNDITRDDLGGAILAWVSS